MTEATKLVDGFKKLDTTSVSDALDHLGIAGGLLGMKAVTPGTVLCGQAFTVRYAPCGEVKGTVGDFLDDVPEGHVLALDNAGRLHCTVWGDLMTITAQRNNLGGTVIDGVCRDVPAIRASEYPIFTKGAYMVTGKDRVYVDGVNIPVSICGVQVKQGDIMLGDDTGVLVVPLERAAQVLETARHIAEKEKMIEERLHQGATLREARSSVGYHTLQTRVSV